VFDAFERLDADPSTNGLKVGDFIRVKAYNEMSL